MNSRLVVKVSAPQEKNLEPRQRRLLQGILARIDEAGLVANSDSVDSDRIEERYSSLRRSHGVLIVAMAQWEAHRLYRNPERKVILPSEFTHIGAAMAVAAKRPLLLLKEKGVAERGILRSGYVHPVIHMPATADSDWLDSGDFNNEFSKWLAQVRCHRHVFLGYSTQAAEVADQVKEFIADQVGLTILDWRDDFRAGGAIWDAIEEAERRTECGVFLFMAEDKVTSSRKQQLAPRDNVIYEAGYFASAKGRPYTTIIREKGAKVPSDLTGILMLELENRSDLSPITTKLRNQLIDAHEGRL